MPDLVGLGWPLGAKRARLVQMPPLSQRRASFKPAGSALCFAKGGGWAALEAVG